MNLRTLHTRYATIRRLVTIFFILFALTALLAELTFWLSGAGDVDIAQVEAIPTPERQATEPEALHALSEWSSDSEIRFQQAPVLLAERAARGQLPPLEQRLPENPLVIHPAHQMGPYGGTWTRYGTSPSDVGIFHHRLAYDGLVRAGSDGTRNIAKPGHALGHRRRGTKLHVPPAPRRALVRWTPFSADDILFWYRDVLHNEELTPVIPIEYRKGGQTVICEKIDDHTIRFRFAEPYGLFLKQHGL